MTRKFSLSMTRFQHEWLHSILYPGDGMEAVAFALCGQRSGKERCRLLVKEVYPAFPQFYENRSSGSVTWSTDALEEILKLAGDLRCSIVKFHSHPIGFPQFSAIDDTGDSKLLPCIRDWFDGDVPHGSAVMLPGGQIFGRVLEDDRLSPIDTICVLGDDLLFWHSETPCSAIGDFTVSHAQAFGEGMVMQLKGLTIAVVGCSGTGSPVVKQLMRLGVGTIILVDDEITGNRNLNRIIQAKQRDVDDNRPKVDVLSGRIEEVGLGTRVRCIEARLDDVEAIEIVAEADVVFGCMDSVEGRYYLNRLATYYLIPYFDIGVRLIADGASGIDEICGTVHYLQPGRSSLISRGLFSQKDVAEESLRRLDLNAHTQQISDGYIKGVQEERPAVISVNMLAAALAVHEFTARLHPYREDPNEASAAVTFSLASMELYVDAEEGQCELLRDKVGAGDVEPPLGLLALAKRG